LSTRLMPQTLFHDIWDSDRRHPETGERLCRVCNHPIVPPKHYYCSDNCSTLAQLSVSWDYARRQTLKRDQGCCQFPGCTRAITWQARNTTNTAHVHHIFPVKKIRRLSWDLVYEWGIEDEQRLKVFSRVYTLMFLDPNNLISYCTEHHKMIHAADGRKHDYPAEPVYKVARTFWANFWEWARRDHYTRTLDQFFGR